MSPKWHKPPSPLPPALLWEHHGTCKAGATPLLSLPRRLAGMLGIHFWWQCPSLLWALSPPAFSWDGSAGSTSLGTYQHSKAVTAVAGIPCHAGKISNVVNSPQPPQHPGHLSSHILMLPLFQAAPASLPQSHGQLWEGYFWHVSP